MRRHSCTLLQARAQPPWPAGLALPALASGPARVAASPTEEVFEEKRGSARLLHPDERICLRRDAPAVLASVSQLAAGLGGGAPSLGCKAEGLGASDRALPPASVSRG